jgi:4-hydroxy-4-methyl-2-oxoglutarate aldolase
VSNLDDLLEAGTAVIADVFDELGRRPPALANDLVAVGDNPGFAGPAFTVAGRSEEYEGADRPKLAAIDAMPAGSVAVWAGTDIRGVCCFGDLLASSMRARGVTGVVVDGGIRDAAFLERLDLPILARYRTPAQAIGRWRVTAVDEPISLRGAIDDHVTVAPGDVVVADADGAIVVPADLVDEVAQRAVEWARNEGPAREEIAGGLPLLEAIERYGHL